jgi:EpsD family peptidyl-prolyl cis-trans isomerase
LLGVLSIMLVASISGCEKLEKSTSASQVVAQVNSEDITVHQLNAALARVGDVTPESVARVKREVLQRLVDRQLAVQHALSKKLDRSPAVLQALEGARADILARAYVEEVARSLPKPTAEEVSKFYAEHPQLFAQRRVFVLEEIEAWGEGDLVLGLREAAAKSRSMKEVAAWLKSRDVRFSEFRGVRAAEQVPLEMLPRLQAMKDGESAVVELADARAQWVRVVVAKPAPVDAATAAPRIEQFLFNRRSSEAVDREMQRLKDAATIRYLGEFAAAGVGETAVKQRVGRTDAGAKTGDH